MNEHSTRQELTVNVGSATVTVTVDYGQSPPTIATYTVAGEYESGDALEAADDGIHPARWSSSGFYGSHNEAEGRDIDAAQREAFALAAKRWRVFRRRDAAARATWEAIVARERNAA